MGKIHDLYVPDIGDFKDVPIIELLVAPGDLLDPDTPVVTIESDKASMEVPSEVTGVVTELLVQEGDTVSEGSILLRYQQKGEPVPEVLVQAAAEHVNVNEHPEETKPQRAPADSDQPAVCLHSNESATCSPSTQGSGPAGPAVRRLARELGVTLSEVSGSGAKGRISKEDVRNHVKRIVQGELERPRLLKQTEKLIDFSQFGEIVERPLSRIQRLSGSQLAGNWAAIPHVTSFDEVDITELEAFRKQLKSEQSVKLTLLAFVLKAVQVALKDFPQLNSSIQGENLIVKKYYHLGFAVDTPAGLLVAVIRDVERKGVIEISREVRELAERAREGKLKPEQMQGGTFTVSSLGSAGGTHFTPIINAPEVAILALGRTAIKPVWDGSQFQPGLLLPLSLSWDHRALDGVTASRFNRRLCELLGDFRRVIL